MEFISTNNKSAISSAAKSTEESWKLKFLFWEWAPRFKQEK